MKLCVVTPGADYASRAGARIRYLRLAAPLARLGHTLALVPIRAFAAGEEPLDGAVYLLSKCHDAGAILLARELRRRGKCVGIDLFDDYFSHADDSRFARLRAWLAAAVESADFILCSTDAMREVAAGYAPNLPIHVLNDPAPAFDVEALAAALVGSRERALSSGAIDVAWFGMGDNPNFPVGLEDLAAFGDGLARLRGPGFDVRLHVLTNWGAMKADAIRALGRLPIRWEASEWSEAAEAELLARSYVAFLPVNAQSFSTAKSPNRAITALTAGAQALSVGYPLYAPLGPLVYRDPDAVLHDLLEGAARLRPGTIGQLVETLTLLGDPAEEASRLDRFLAGASGRRPKPDGPTALVHGRDTTELAHAMAQTLGMLSIASPLTAKRLDYDIEARIADDGTGIDLFVHERAVGRIDPSLARRLRVDDERDGYRSVKITESMPGSALARLAAPTAQAAAHPLVLDYMAGLAGRLFPGVELVLSEDFRMAWQLPTPYAGGTVAR